MVVTSKKHAAAYSVSVNWLKLEAQERVLSEEIFTLEKCM